jgi:uncharacterized membrane protein
MYKIIVGFIASVLSASFASADGMWGGHMGGDWFNMMGGIFLGIIFLIVIAVGIGIAIYAVTRLSGASPSAGLGKSHEEKPIAILKARFAKGEISGDEYEKTLKALNG